MSLKIRLARGGTKKRPFYRMVVADKRYSRDGRFIEKLGVYNPLLAKDSKDRLVFDQERVQHWLGQGAQPTEVLVRMFTNAGIKHKIIEKLDAKRQQSIKARLENKRKKEEVEKAAKEAEAAKNGEAADGADSTAKSTANSENAKNKEDKKAEVAKEEKPAANKAEEKKEEKQEEKSAAEGKKAEESKAEEAKS